MSKILIVAPAWVGDMVMAQTLFRFLTDTDPDVVIDVIAPDATRSLLERMPEVRKAIALPLKHGELGLKQRYALGCSLREERYDQAIVLTNTFKSALVPFWANIPVRTGWQGEMRFGILNDRRHLNKKALPLMIQRFVALGLPADQPIPDRLPKPALKVSPYSVAQVLEQHNIHRTENPLLVLCPGAEFGPAKRWPPAYYAELAEAKLAAGWDVWLMGSKGDQAATAEIQTLTENRCLDLAGKTSLLEAVDLLSLADIVVTNDSGLMHVAAALDKPLVVIYGSTDPRFTPPLTHRAQILSLGLACSPCFKRECPLEHMNCLNDLSVSRVLSALDHVYSDS